MLIVLTLAVTRVIRMVRLDTIFTPLRIAVMTQSGADGWWTKLLTCSFCVGFWASLSITPYLLWPHNPCLLGAYTVLAVAEVAPRILHWDFGGN